MKKKTNLNVPVLAGLFILANSASAMLWTAGHGDLGVEYLGSGDLELEWHLGEDNETVVIDNVPQTFGPGGQGFEAADLTAQTDLSGSRPAGSQWDFTGAASGESIYAFPQLENATVPFLGIGTEELNPADWSTDLTYTLTGFSGPGDFSLYTVDGFGTLTEFISTDGGITGSVAQAAGTHAHYNWTFTEIGTYDLTFDVSATHDTDGLATGAETFTFSVVPEPSAFASIAGLLVLAAVGLRRRRS